MDVRGSRNVDVQTISIAGVTMSSMLFNMVSSKSDMEGFLLGTVDQRTVTHLDDNDGQVEQHETSIEIQTFVASGGPLSFYDATGHVKVEKLNSLTVEHPENLAVIGWFMFRRNTPLRPSLRELAVSAALDNLLTSRSTPAVPRRAGQRPSIPPPATALLFAVFSASTSANASIHSFDFRFFQRDPSSRKLAARNVAIRNLQQSSLAEYNAFAPTSYLFPAPSLLSSSPPSESRGRPTSASGTVGSTASPLADLISSYGEPALEALSRMPPPHVSHMERLFECTLDIMQKLAAQISEAEQELADTFQEQQHGMDVEPAEHS